jgi:hypothetical protein
LDEFINNGYPRLCKCERRYHALLCAAEVFKNGGDQAGITIRRGSVEVNPASLAEITETC